MPRAATDTPRQSSHTMSLFNLRQSEAAAPNAGSGAQPESAEQVRRRAKHRLIGSAVLVLAGVLGFPLLFDTQPRPVAVDIPIEIPARNTAKPSLPAQPATVAKPAATEKVGVDSGFSEKEEIIDQKQLESHAARAQAAIKTEASAVPKVEAKPEPKPEPKPVQPEPRAHTKATPAATADAAMPSTGEARLVVQVGAFSDADKAREVRLKLEKAGLKTYTQVAETKDGKRIRVRVGPFVTKAEADKAVSKIKSLDMPAAVLSL